MKKFVAVFFILLVNYCPAQNLIALADSLIKANQVPEIAYAIVTKNSILEIAYLGHHKINGIDTASAMDRFHLGSDTKAITGFIAAKLVEENKIKWTTKFFDIYPTWKQTANKAYWNMTLEQLFSHTAGIEPFVDLEEFNKYPPFTGHKEQQRLAFGKLLVTLPPAKPVGNTKFVYSNGSYVLASLMLDKVTGKTWEQQIEQTLNKNLGLQPAFGWPYLKDPKQVWGHYEKDGKILDGADYDFDKLPIGPAGDVNMTLPDYIKFIQLNLEGLSGGNNYLHDSTYRFLHLGIPNYSIGWGNNNGKNESTLYSTHTGSAGTSLCFAWLDQNKYIGYIVMLNSATQAAKQAMIQMEQTMRKKYGSF